MTMSKQMQDMTSAAISELDSVISNNRLMAQQFDGEIEAHQKTIDKLKAQRDDFNRQADLMGQARAALVTVAGIDQSKPGEEKINDDLPDESAKPAPPAKSFLEAFDDLFGGTLRDLFPGAYKSTDDDDEPDWGNING